MPSKAVVLLLFVVAPILWGLVLCLVCTAVLCVISSFVIISLGKREMVAFLLYCSKSMEFRCQCSLTFPHRTMGLSVLCDCCISWSYALTFSMPYNIGIIGQYLKKKVMFTYIMFVY